MVNQALYKGGLEVGGEGRRDINDAVATMRRLESNLSPSPIVKFRSSLSLCVCVCVCYCQNEHDKTPNMTDYASND